MSEDPARGEGSSPAQAGEAAGQLIRRARQVTRRKFPARVCPCGRILTCQHLPPIAIYARRARFFSSALIAPDFNAAKRWITRDLLGKSVNSYDAMLLYAKGIVERERNLTADRGKSTFAAMMTAVEKMEDSYPSNFRHIAQGLAISRGGADAQSILNQVKEVDVYPAATPLTFDPPIAPQQNIYVGPADQFQKRAMTIDISQAHLLLKKGEWYLGNGLGWVGWLHRPSKSS